MLDNADGQPTMPLEMPAHDHDAQAEYDEELFQYHQRLRAWKAQQATHRTTGHPPDED